jgi:hypothetical protein
MHWINTWVSISFAIFLNTVTIGMIVCVIYGCILVIKEELKDEDSEDEQQKE